MKIVDARTARILTNEVIQNNEKLLEKQLDYIALYIKDAINKGEYSALIEVKDIPEFEENKEVLKNALSDLGYITTEANRYFGCVCKQFLDIVW